MAAAGLLKTLDDGGDGRLQKEELTVDAHLPHGIQGAEQLIEIFPASDVADHGHLVIAAAAAQAQLREAGHEQCGHIVNGVKPFVLQKLSCRALASAGESGDDDHLHRFFPLLSDVLSLSKVESGHSFDLQLQGDPLFLSDDLSDLIGQRQHVSTGGAASVDDESGVFLADLGAAYGQPL